jgi:hypothetical protein
VSPDKALEAAAETFRERGKTYGDNWMLIGAVMDAIFPDGYKAPSVNSWNRFHLWFLILVKMTRLAVTDFRHKDSAHDITVYAAMLESLIGD